MGHVVVIATVDRMKASQRLIARKRRPIGLSSPVLINLQQELINMPAIWDNIPHYNQKKSLMVKESNRIRKEKSRAARSVLKREFDTERELFLHNKRRKARSPEKIILDKEKHRLYEKKRLEGRSLEKILLDKEKHRLYSKKRRLGETLRRLFLKKKTTNNLTEKEIEKLYKLDELYTDIYSKILGKKSTDPAAMTAGFTIPLVPLPPPFTCDLSALASGGVDDDSRDDDDDCRDDDDDDDDLPLTLDDDCVDDDDDLSDDLLLDRITVIDDANNEDCNTTSNELAAIQKAVASLDKKGIMPCPIHAGAIDVHAIGSRSGTCDGCVMMRQSKALAYCKFGNAKVVEDDNSKLISSICAAEAAPTLHKFAARAFDDDSDSESEGEDIDFGLKSKKKKNVRLKKKKPAEHRLYIIQYNLWRKLNKEWLDKEKDGEHRPLTQEENARLEAANLQYKYDTIPVIDPDFDKDNLFQPATIWSQRPPKFIFPSSDTMVQLLQEKLPPTGDKSLRTENDWASIGNKQVFRFKTENIRIIFLAMYIQSTASTADKVCVNHFKALARFFCDENHDLYKLDLEDFKDVKLVCQLFRRASIWCKKSYLISNLTTYIINNKEGIFPSTKEFWMSLTGWDSKLTSLLLFIAFDQEFVVPVDSHVFHLSVLFGWTAATSPKELAWAIYTGKLVKPEHAIPLNDLLGSIGQYIGSSKKNEITDRKTKAKVHELLDNTTSEEWKSLYRRLL